MVIFTMFLLIIVAAFYMNRESYQLQSDWVAIEKESEKMKNEQGYSTEMDLQALMLALRTQAHKNPENGEVWYELGKAYATLQMSDMAIAAWERALRLEKRPQWMIAMAQLFSVMPGEDNTVKAIELFQQVLSVVPEHQGAMYYLGYSYLKNKELKNAFDTWNLLRQIKTISPKMKQHLSQQLVQIENRIKNPSN